MLDATKYIGPYIKNVTIKHSISPPPKNSKKEYTPIEAIITISSKNYIEDWFAPGRTVKIYMGYDRINPSLIFSGTIAKFPDGSAKEMLNYTVRIVGDIIVLGLSKKK